jgi:hypothetical protein
MVVGVGDAVKAAVAVEAEVGMTINSDVGEANASEVSATTVGICSGG